MFFFFLGSHHPLQETTQKKLGNTKFATRYPLEPINKKLTEFFFHSVPTKTNQQLVHYLLPIPQTYCKFDPQTHMQIGPQA